MCNGKDPMNRTLDFSDTLFIEECCKCGISFAMPSQYRNRLRDNPGSTFYCPSGHAQHYTGKSEAQKLREQLTSAQHSLEYSRERAQQAIRSRNAMKGQVTKIKNRIGKGVCPCCNRSFPSLASHMETEHPEFADA